MRAGAGAKFEPLDKADWILRPLEIQVVLHPLTTLRQLLVHPKDPVPMEERKGVV